MPRLFTNEASFNDLHVSGSTIMSASSGLTTKIIGSGSTVLSVTGSGGQLLAVNDINTLSIFSVSSGSNTILDISAVAPNLFSVSSGSNTILAVDSTRQVLLNVSGSTTTGVKMIGIPQQTASFLLTYISESGVVGYSSNSNFTASNIQGGQTNYHTIWTSPTTISSSRLVYENNNEIGIGFPTASIGSTNRRLNIGGSTYIESGSLQLSRFGKTQIIITDKDGAAGGSSTGSGDHLIAIGSNTANALTTGGANLVAIGVGAGNSLTTGGGSSVHIGRNSGGGITSGSNNTMIGMGDQTNIPTASSNTIHIIAGGGYQFNNAASLLGAPDNILTSGYAFIGGGFDATRYVNNFYLGAGPFVPDAQSANLNIYSPSGTGSNIVGSNFTINAGRGTGTGSAGDIFFATSTTGSTGGTLQTLSNRVVVKGTTGNVGIGISTPSSKLHVAGTTTLSSSAETTTLTMFGSASSATPLLLLSGSKGELVNAWDIISGSILTVNNDVGVPVMDVFSNGTIKMGLWPIPGMYTSYRSTIPSASYGTDVTIYSIPTSSYDAAFFDYHLLSGSNMRVGQFMAGWSGSNVEYSEVTTGDFGNTSFVTMSADVSNDEFRFRAHSSGGNWTIKTIIRAI